MKVRIETLPVSLRGLVGVFMLVQIGWIALLAYHTWHRQKDELETSLLTDARFLATASKATFDTVGFGLVGLADRLHSELREPLVAPLASTKVLRFAQRLYEPVASISLVTPQGHILANSLYPDPKSIPQPPNITDFSARINQFRSAQHGYIVGATERGTSSDKWRIVIRQNHYRADGTPHFILSANIPIDSDRPLWSNLSVPEKHALTIARLDGTIVARWPAPAPEKIYGATPETPLMRFLARHMQKGAEGSMYIPTSVDGRERLAVFSQIDNLPLVAIASVDYSLLTDLWFSRNRGWFISGALFLCLSVSVFLYLTLLERRVHGALELDSHTDALTGLLNRRGIFAQADLAFARRVAPPMSLFFLDLDHFKAVNDQHGHDCGDELLRQCAQRIRMVIREKDLAARLGGDEFVIALPNTDRKTAQVILQRLHEQFIPPFHIGDLQLAMHPSVGTASAPEHGQDLEALLSAADKAMYEDKARRRLQHPARSAPPADQQHAE